MLLRDLENSQFSNALILKLFGEMERPLLIILHYKYFGSTLFENFFDIHIK